MRQRRRRVELSPLRDDCSLGILEDELMQTFMPYPNFEESAKVLDRQRLGRQRVEVLQILNSLCGSSYGWRNHPAVKMWRGHEAYLIAYGCAICLEWISRGFKDTTLEKIVAFATRYNPHNTTEPDWLGNPEFHSSHRSALLYKNPQWYGRFGWTEKPKIEYIWPAQGEK